MNKKIKAIDLLNMLANREYDKLPKKIRRNGVEYQLRLLPTDNVYEYTSKDFLKDVYVTMRVTANKTSLNDDVEIIEEETILTEKEKEYLSAVIRPFRDKTKSIEKVSDYDEEYIYIEFKNCRGMYFPDFKKNTIYKNMEVNRPYTLEELGL